MSKRDPWQREPGAHDIERGGKKYRNLALYTRACATCGTRFGIYVSQAVADGHKSNNNFGLKNCEQHRTSAVDRADAVALRTANATMRDELTGLYARNKAIFEELQQCKARLATYELGPAMIFHVDSLTADGMLKPGAQPVPAMELNARTLEDALVTFNSDPTLSVKTHVDFKGITDFAIGCEPVQNTISSEVAFPWNKA